MARSTARPRAPFMEYARFVAAGGLNTATDFIVLNSLLSLAAVPTTGVLYVICKSASFLVAVIQSFFLNRYWVFKIDPSRGPNMEETGRFFLVSAAGFLLNIAGSALVFNLLGSAQMFDPLIRANIGALAGTLIVLAWNYIGYKFFVFNA